MTDQQQQEHLGPLARSIADTFANLTLPQQRRVFAMLQEILDENERIASMLARLRNEAPEQANDT